MAASERHYVDSSVLLAQLLREETLFAWLDRAPVTSEISELECRRTLDRIRLQEQLADAEIADRLSELDLLLRAIRIIPLDSTVMKRAKASFPTVVRSLDAIHLATAALAKCPNFLTRDRQQAIAAKALGLKVES